MSVLIYSLISAIIISLISFVGLITLTLKEHFLNKIIIFLVSFSTGSLMGTAFFHLLPESLEKTDDYLKVFIFVLIGFSLFFILERILRWHHCHDQECETHKHLGTLNLIGDGIHNIIDGIIIISAFWVNFSLGSAVTLSIILHEVPQELSDFGVLLYSGFKKSEAFLYNFKIALLSLLGVFIGYFLIQKLGSLNQFLIPFTAGSFFYIAASDLVPELHKERDLKKALFSFLMFFLALVLMLILRDN